MCLLTTVMVNLLNYKSRVMWVQTLWQVRSLKPGGGLAKTGGYIVGKEKWVEACSYRMTSPGIGSEAGASLYALQEMYQGFFLAPHVVAQSLKGAVFTARFLENSGSKQTRRGMRKEPT